MLCNYDTSIFSYFLFNRSNCAQYFYPIRLPYSYISTDRTLLPLEKVKLCQKFLPYPHSYSYFYSHISHPSPYLYHLCLIVYTKGQPVPNTFTFLLHTQGQTVPEFLPYPHFYSYFYYHISHSYVN